MNPTLSWPHIRARLKEACLTLPHFFRNPVQGIRNLPSWEWPEMLILQAGFAAACAILTSAVAHNYLGMLTGLIVGPITQILIVGISGLFFYWVFKFAFHRAVPYRQIYLLLMFAAIPTQLTNILAPVIPPANLIGVIATALLLFVGFVDNFHLDRVKIRTLLGALVALYLVTWTMQMLNLSHHREHLREKATPESMDILERELNPDSE